MRAFAQKPKATQQTTSAKSTIPGRAHFGQSRELNSILHLQRTIGNQATQRMLQTNAEELEVGLASTASPRFAHDVSHIPLHLKSPANVQAKLTVGPPGDIYEQKADCVSEQVMRMPEPQLQGACCGCPKCRKEQGCHEQLQTTRVQENETTETVPRLVRDVISSSGQPLEPSTRMFMESRFGHDFCKVRVHTDARSVESARALGARAYTVGSRIVFGVGQYAPGTTKGQRLLGHELTHVEQQKRAGRPSLQLKSELESIPENERKKVQVLTSVFTDEGQKIIDQAYLNQTDVLIPAERTVQFAASVAQFRRKGLKNVVFSLTTPAKGALQAFLPRNSTINLAIPAAEAVFQFTRLDRPSTAAAGAAGPTPEVVLVEQVGVIPREPKPLWEAFPGPFSEAPGPLPARESSRMRECLARADLDYCRMEVLGQGARKPAPVVLKPGKVEIRTVKIERGPNWKESEWTAVSAVLAALPDSALHQAAGITFQREAKNVCKAEEVTAGSCDPEESGNNDAVRKKITIFDNAFKMSTTRYGTSSWIAQVVAHELGHQADFAPLGMAFAQFKQTKDEKKVLASRSRSGSAWIKHALRGNARFQYTEVGGGATKGSFREAAIQDGLQVEDNNKKIVGGGVTKYGQKSWRELFAESFALYITDPDLLRAIRPNVFKYLEQAYPK